MGKTISPWGRQCKSRMALSGMTLKELSASVGLSQTYVSAIINGRLFAPEDTIEKINRALRIEQSSSN